MTESTFPVGYPLLCLPDLDTARLLTVFEGRIPGGKLLREAALDGVELIVLQNLRKARAAGLEVDDFDSQERGLIHRDLLWERQLERVLACGVDLSPPVLLKGTGTRYRYYSRPELRSCNDVDILVPKAELDAWQRALQELGYQARPGEVHPGWHTTNLHREDQGVSVLVELHDSLDNTERSEIDYKDLAGLCGPAKVLGESALIPGDEAQLLVAGTHLLRQGLSIPLKNLVDVHLIAQRLSERGSEGPGDDLSRLLHRAPGAGASIGWMLSACISLFGSPSPLSWIDALAPPRISRLPLRFTARPFRRGFSLPPLESSPRMRMFWYQLLLSGSPSMMARVFRAWLTRRR